jgi:3-hydroxypropanoate dehydrogenase
LLRPGVTWLPLPDFATLQIRNSVTLYDMLDDPALDLLFREARTVSAWLDRPVTDAQLRALYDLAKWPPTSANSNPARFWFLRTPEAKERLRPALSRSNVDKVMTAPVTVIVAYDLAFTDKMDKLSPHSTSMRDLFLSAPDFALTTAKRNSTLQGGYLILAARALGLDCGPLSGFNNDKVDAEFFASTTLRSNFLCNLGYGDRTRVRPRAPRLEFEEACTVL